MIPCYPCLPRLLEAAAIFKKWVELADNGMWIALAFPYPSTSVAMLGNTPLTAFYQNVFNNLRTVADTLRSRVKPGTKDRVRIFVPNLKDDGDSFPLMMPTMGLAEYRPMFARFTGKDEDEEDPQSLVAWLRVNEHEKDRCISLFPDADTDAVGLQNIVTFNYWADYFRDITNVWNDLNRSGQDNIGWSSGNHDFGKWKLY